ncbi:YlzJ-like family protein [Lederbergia graminis]|uniref:YlzJ-like family protein n=1 Tax=Lederbergia graminis TaxID=735518 RepID=A0ABW0LFH3_9BACI
MIIHSIVPPELIFPNQEEQFSNQIPLVRNGVPMIVEQSGDMYKVVRIMSSNPCDYLRDDICPGAYISLNE